MNPPKHFGVNEFNCHPHQGVEQPAGPGWTRSKFLFGAFVALLFAIGPGVSCAQSQADEYRLKAAFLFHFAQFVDWPADASGNADTPFVICVMGEDPFHGDLEQSVRGKLIATRAVQVRHIKQLQDGQVCHVVFVGKDESNIPTRISALRHAPILTVGESEDFLRQGGIIRMFVEDRKIRFDINQRAAETANLKISSRLLLLARAVVESERR